MVPLILLNGTLYLLHASRCVCLFPTQKYQGIIYIFENASFKRYFDALTLIS